LLKKLNKKTIKTLLCKRFQRKNCFLSQLAAHSPPAHATPCAGDKIRRSIVARCVTARGLSAPALFDLGRPMEIRRIFGRIASSKQPHARD
jgi:hypothetical protein